MTQSKYCRRAILTSALFLWCIAAAGGPPRTQGAYKLHFKGCYTGRGNAAVAAKSVTITGHLIDSAGNRANFTAANLPLTKNCFSGTTTVFGLPLTLIGRVDPPDNVLPHACLVCTFEVSPKMTFRAVGVGP